LTGSAFYKHKDHALDSLWEKLEEMGLHLGMELSKYGITRENVKQFVQDFNAEKMSKTL